MRLAKKGLKYILFFSLGYLAMTSCVPIKNRLVLTDKKEKTLAGKQREDTIVQVQPFEYKIRKGDLLAVEIISLVKSEYSMGNVTKNGGDAVSGYIVNDSGYVDVPIIGLVKAEGQTLSQIQRDIKTIASEYLNNVTVTVKLLNFTVTVFGEAVGAVSSPDGRLSVIQAIAQVGGASEFANIKRVKIIRQIEDGTKIRVFYVDISDIALVNSKDFYLLPKDILVVEPSRAKNFSSYRQIVGVITVTISSLLLIYSINQRFK